MASAFFQQEFYNIVAMKNVIVLGAGLTGLTLAYQLKKAGIAATLIEARNRPGGRIHTRYNEGEAPVEMGATWLGEKHESLLALLQELDIPVFEQFLQGYTFYEPISTSPPQVFLLPDQAPNYRIAGGSSTLISKLLNEMDPEQVVLGQRIQKVEYQDGVFVLESADRRFSCNILISTIPPKLLVERLEFTPKLPPELLQKAQQTHTWMGESIKVAITYPRAFWREKNYSGSVFSNVGPISELYDHSNVEQSLFALKGFMSGALHGAAQEQRKTLVIEQLVKYFGEVAREYTTYFDCVWQHEPETFAPYHGYILPHQHNGDPIFRADYFGGNFIIAGTETASAFPGYMDGAVLSGMECAERVKVLTMN